MLQPILTASHVGSRCIGRCFSTVVAFKANFFLGYQSMSLFPVLCSCMAEFSVAAGLRDSAPKRGNS